MIDSHVLGQRPASVDGFRFDLMGIHDVETMQIIRDRLDKVDHVSALERMALGYGGDRQRHSCLKIRPRKTMPIGFHRHWIFSDNESEMLLKGAEVFGTAETSCQWTGIRKIYCQGYLK